MYIYISKMTSFKQEIGSDAFAQRVHFLEDYFVERCVVTCLWHTVDWFDAERAYHSMARMNMECW